MKRIYNIAICCIAVCFLAACSKEYDFSEVPAGGDGNSIILDISSSALPVSRATVKAEGAEVAVSHIDVLIFDDTDAKKLVWSDRVSEPANKSGLITLAAKRESFTANARYWVYLIANSTHPESDFTNLADLNALKAMTQDDENIHMTGLPGTETTPFPATFLMDGIAYPEGVEEPALDAVAPVVLNDGVSANDTELKVTLRRAAAKVVVTIKQGTDVTFDTDPVVHGAVYYLRNMPYTTSVIAGVDGDPELKDSYPTSGGYSDWGAEQITVTAYMYAHAWDNESSLEQEVRLVMNIPMTYNKDTDPQLRENNYYQVPVCSGKALERNTCYMVTATVNAPGAESPATPATLTNVLYTVADWTEETIYVGDDDGRPKFLTLNQYDLEMHNMEDDHTSLIFTSSSDVSASIDRVYFYDKFGQQQILEKVTGTDNEYGISTGGWRPTWTNRCTIKITPDKGLNGKLDVYSTLPENNTIRYIEVTVTNVDGIKRKLTIEQYPLEYITNVVGRYSYRDDFGGTTAENKGNPLRASAHEYNERTGWTYSNEFQYTSGRYTYNYFFTSKVVTSTATTGDNKGKSYIRYYRWERSNSSNYTTQIIWRDDYNREKYMNARMYHVQITASSGKYTLGKPRITDGKTDPGLDNAQLVSPSFMIASQLGATLEPKDANMAASHCEQYVEVAEDGTVYDDWRLPTRAEVQIIMDFQYKSNAAMDEVLAGGRYWCADGGYVQNPQNDETQTAIRCIRDAYDDKE
ncbi:MAG: fimbrial protein [Alistipes sp.]|nr:fimbrial protein [Alistipes sp.]